MEELDAQEGDTRNRRDDRVQGLGEIDSQTHAILPSIFRSVPAVTRVVGPFFIPERLIDPRLYRTIMGEGDARRVSYQEASRFIDRLNGLCEGTAEFGLPTEEQFVAVARLLYDPIRQGLRECSVVRWSGTTSLHISKLFGHYWQLTRSPCVPFSAGARVRCADGSFVRKGGSETSTNALQCLPQFRGEAPPDVALRNTSLRLVLVQ